jgi:predicted restriction endonuclease
MKMLQKLDLRGNPMPIPPQVLGYGQDEEGCGNLRTILDSYFHTRNLVLPELNAERQKIESEGYFDVETLQDARQRIITSIVQRQGQAEFRGKLLIAYGGRCPITDCDVESAIEAAHIIPYQGTQTNHLTNGLPLRADIHTLFDLHLLSIRPDTNEVVIAPELVGTCYQDLADRKLTLPQDQKRAPNQNALSKHYKIFLSKCKSG